MSVQERVYHAIFDEEEVRACADIPEDACREAPRSFVLNAANGAATKFAEQLASPDLVLPWLLSVLGAPVFISGLLVPFRRAASLLPQLAVSAKIRAQPVRKTVWVKAAIVQVIALALMALLVAFLPVPAAGFGILVLVVAFSLAGGVASVSYKDVLAKTIPKGKRGRLLATRATVGGGLTLAAGFVLFLVVQDSGSRWPYVALLATASGLFAVAAVLFASIQELPGETEGGRTPLEEIRAAGGLLRRDAGLRRFILLRSLLLLIPLLQPFYVLRARALTGSALGGLGLFVIAAGVGRLLGAPIWGGPVDRSARVSMAVASLLGAVAAGFALLFPLLPSSLQILPVFAPVFLLNTIAYAGARLARKTYLVDYAPSGDRPLYVSLTNTVIGLVMLAGTLLGVIAQFTGVPPVIAGGLVLLVVAALIAAGLEET
jgi:MFS family permease